jgi:hypothetical protein
MDRAGAVGKADAEGAIERLLAVKGAVSQEPGRDGFITELKGDLYARQVASLIRARDDSSPP